MIHRSPGTKAANAAYGGVKNNDSGGRPRIVLRFILAAGFLFAGWMHVHQPDIFLRIVPSWMPVPRTTVILTGWCEIAGALGLLVPRLRRTAAIMLAIYAVCVFPANIKHAIDYAHHGGGIGWLYHAPRLLFQPVIVWWCLFAGNVIDWPVAHSASADAADRS